MQHYKIMTILSVFFKFISPKHTRACSSSKAGKSVWYSSKTSKQVQCIETVAAQSADCMACSLQTARCSLQTARGFQIAWNIYTNMITRVINIHYRLASPSTEKILSTECHINATASRWKSCFRKQQWLWPGIPVRYREKKTANFKFQSANCTRNDQSAEVKSRQWLQPCTQCVSLNARTVSSTYKLLSK